MDVSVAVLKKTKRHTRSELENFPKEQLVDRIIQLESQNFQLKNIIQKVTGTKTEKSNENNKKQRKFDFSNCHKRHILLRFYYLGWNYQGYASQEDSANTIEHHLFNALTRVCLIENRESSNYHRCGRTDKGVSAFHQVVSLDIRSKFPPESQLAPESIATEINYCQLLNRVLPEDIRCVAWMPMVNPNYSARFDCRSRTYRYFFPRGSLDVEAMQEGCKHLVGSHDFRNLCKMDVGNGVVTFMRNVHYAFIKESQKDDDESPYDMLYFELRGKAFLWHQVRCIMAILILIGEGREESTVIRELLDVEKNPRKPQYSLANDMPLNLYECKFKSKGTFDPALFDRNGPILDDDEEVEEVSDLQEWVYEEESISRTISELQGLWTTNSIKSTMCREMLKSLAEIYSRVFPNKPKPINQTCVLLQGVQSKEYRSLMSRDKCESLENRIEHYAKKRRIQISVKQADDVSTNEEK
ncbi:tRNA pseudouridine(38/39) synthase [Toxorhynchites rutilus septentrionalis]|uniref:tRNA pseudouridine(38/39) synthase n=1 Tax=Toxorhynchites rutilus septentrionalis TaxID=329112 RepID=UPI00247A160A|nr:tRNA pseudouridine(38/39) synthase [Toxorhynchites rutilus septentrionalis]